MSSLIFLEKIFVYATTVEELNALEIYKWEEPGENGEIKYGKFSKTFNDLIEMIDVDENGNPKYFQKIFEFNFLYRSSTHYIKFDYLFKNTTTMDELEYKNNSQFNLGSNDLFNFWNSSNSKIFLFLVFI